MSQIGKKKLIVINAVALVVIFAVLLFLQELMMPKS
jgi:hypothetical protein